MPELARINWKPGANVMIGFCPTVTPDLARINAKL
jgi:hypothetical protein